MTKPTCAAIIIGIDGWEQYTLPLIESICKHEPDCGIYLVDNASEPPYPHVDHICRIRTERLCYSAAINTAQAVAEKLDYDPVTNDVVARKPDWYIVLSNDVLCTGPFIDEYLAQFEDTDVVGPLIKDIQIERVGNVSYVEGWCVCISRRVWDTIGGWDDGMKISSYEDVEYSHRARTHGFYLAECADLPFTHLDQKQRFYLVPDYWSSEHHNRARFVEKYAVKP